MIAAAEPTGAVPHSAQLIPADPRVVAAAELLAERHQPSALATAQLRRLLAMYERRMRGLLDVVGAAPSSRDRFQRLQALEDAIKYRHARASEPCSSCDAVPNGRCDDHGRDVDLIGEYEQAATRLCVGKTP